MGKVIEDGMKQECKKTLLPMILGYGLTILAPILIYLTCDSKINIPNTIIIVAGFFIAGTIGLCSWVYYRTYKVKITQEKVMLKTLFKSVDVNIKDITSYTCYRYKNTDFFQFKLVIADKKVSVNTRYRDDFIKIMQENNIKNSDDASSPLTNKEIVLDCLTGGFDTRTDILGYFEDYPRIITEDELDSLLYEMVSEGLITTNYEQKSANGECAYSLTPQGEEALDKIEF